MKVEPSIKKREEESGNRNGFLSNFRASAKGTNKPEMEGLFGPTRSINEPSTLRSNKVKKATAIRSRNKEIIRVIRPKT